VRQATVVIDNGGSRGSTEQQVEAALRSLVPEPHARATLGA